MIISFKKKILFIHIPKCAGESITELLLEENNCGGQFLQKHSIYSQAERILGEEITRFTSFAVIRNPYEQVFSFYEHLRKPKFMDLSLLERQYPGSGGKLQPRLASDLAVKCDFPDYVRQLYTDTPQLHVWMRDLCEWLRNIEGNIMVDYCRSN